MVDVPQSKNVHSNHTSSDGLGQNLDTNSKTDTSPSRSTADIPPDKTRNQKSRRSATDYGEVSRQTWQESKRLKLDGTGNGDVANSTSQARLPKRKVACMIGYCGTGYHGMQLNPPSKTIESELFAAFVKAGAVSEDNADDPKKVSLSRAARTDKGVHAAVNVISLKMIIEDLDIVSKINSHLPAQIRVWKVLRTMKSFNPRSSCDSRVYEYLIPSAAFLPPQLDTQFATLVSNYNGEHRLHDAAESFWNRTNDELQEIRRSAAYMSIKDDDLDVGVLELDKTVPDADKPALYAQLRRSKMIREHVASAKRKFRISDERLEAIRQLFITYKGSKNFHNYTVGQTFSQPNSIRIIKDFQVAEPFLINGTEWLSLKVHGQSFMLHQIRKMVAMVLLVVRSSCPRSRMEQSFTDVKVNIPKAPSLGLLLERPIFDVYNQRAQDLTDREKIELGDMDRTIADFKMHNIYDKIYYEEEKDNPFHMFLSSLDAYAAAGAFAYLFPADAKFPKVQTTPQAVLSEDVFVRDSTDNEAQAEC